MFYFYNLSSDSTGEPITVVIFGAIAGLSSLIQWFIFRNRLTIWWVGANTVAGILLGLLQNHIYEKSSYWWGLHLEILSAVWVIGNFALGRSLLGQTQEEPNTLSSGLPARPDTELIKTGARQNIFLILLALSLVLSALYNFIFAQDLLYDLQKPLLIFYGIAAILAGTSFTLKKEIPRNFGFVTLAVFFSVDGINSMFSVFNPDSPLYFLNILTGIIALSCGIYFVFRPQILKNIGFLLLSGFLISTSLAYFFVTVDTSILKIFLAISAIFALPAAVFIFLRK